MKNFSFEVGTHTTYLTTLMENVVDTFVENNGRYIVNGLHICHNTISVCGDISNDVINGHVWMA